MMVMRMLGLSGLMAYLMGARVGELTASEEPIMEWSRESGTVERTGTLKNKHTILGQNVSFNGRGDVQVELHSSKTSGRNGRKPPRFLFEYNRNSHALSEKGLASLLRL